MIKKIKITLLISSLLILSLASYAEEAVQHKPLTHAIKTLTSNDAKVTRTYYKDLDQDGVKDQYDHCLNTLFGTPVDQYGCEMDHDNDGVVDRIDQCLNSVPGSVVNPLGCENDDDKDGIPNSKEKCPETPPGSNVDSHGCEIIDHDHDNVNDNIDECLDTQLNETVNRHGCKPYQYVLTNIIFESNSHEIQESQKPILRKDAAMLSNLKEDEVVLITGHTDYQASGTSNLRLSWRRANSAKNFIVKELGHLNPKVYINGYGEQYPIANNATEEGRQKNRRIELNVIKISELPRDASLTLPTEMTQ